MDKKEMIKEAVQDKISRFKACATVEEILAVAKAEGIDLTLEQAEEILKAMSGELSDEALEKIAGGGPNFHLLPHLPLTSIEIVK